MLLATHGDKHKLITSDQNRQNHAMTSFQSKTVVHVRLSWHVSVMK